jgi:uncharacterized protein (TIRG00374 family)
LANLGDDVRAHLQTILRIALSLALLGLVALTLRGVDLREALTILLSANSFFLALTLFVQGGTLVLRTIRWKYALLPAQDIPTLKLFPPLLISFAVGNVTVSGVGAIPRVYLVNRHRGVNQGFIVGTIFQELLLDATTVFLWALVVPFLVPLPSQFHVIQLLLILPVLLILFIDLAMIRHESLLVRLLVRLGLWKRAIRALPKWASDNIDTVGLGMGAAFAYRKTTVALVATTVTIWIMEGFIFWLLALSLMIPFSYLQATAATAYTSAVISIIVVPGFLGTLELSSVGLVLSLGGTAAAAVAYTVLLRVFLIGPSTILGLFFAWREGFHLGKE